MYFKKSRQLHVAAMAMIFSMTGMCLATADPAVSNEKSYTGIVAVADAKEQVLYVKGPLWSGKIFNLGKNCTCALLYAPIKDENTGVEILRRGEKVTVHYVNAGGVLIADRVEQKPMQFTGTVRSVDADAGILTLRRGLFDKHVRIASDCIVMTGQDKPGSLADIHPGDHVVVNYEVPERPEAKLISRADTTGR